MHSAEPLVFYSYASFIKLTEHILARVVSIMKEAYKQNNILY